MDEKESGNPPTQNSPNMKNTIYKKDSNQNLNKLPSMNNPYWNHNMIAEKEKISSLVDIIKINVKSMMFKKKYGVNCLIYFLLKGKRNMLF